VVDSHAIPSVSALKRREEVNKAVRGEEGRGASGWSPHHQKNLKRSKIERIREKEEICADFCFFCCPFRFLRVACWSPLPPPRPPMCTSTSFQVRWSPVPNAPNPLTTNQPKTRRCWQCSSCSLHTPCSRLSWCASVGESWRLPTARCSGGLSSRPLPLRAGGYPTNPPMTSSPSKVCPLPSSLLLLLPTLCVVDIITSAGHAEEKAGRLTDAPVDYKWEFLSKSKSTDRWLKFASFRRVDRGVRPCPHLCLWLRSAVDFIYPGGCAVA